MIRAFILWLAGATFEVRLISLRTLKDIPGRCVYKGSYWKARKVFRKQRVKNRHQLRLQAVSFLDITTNDHLTLDEAHDYANQIANQRVANLAAVTRTNPLADGPLPNFVDVPREASHECDEAGPLDFDESGKSYVPTCSVCGKLN